MSKFLVDTYNFPAEAIDSVEDHRLILMARDAQKYRDSQATSKKTVKKLKTLPKVTRPGASKGNQSRALKKSASEKNVIRLHKSKGRTADVANVLMDRI
jgi:hypothetical protein